MVAKIIKIIKCPRCNSTARTAIDKNLYECSQCGNRYYFNLDNNDNMLVSFDDFKKKNNRLVAMIIGAVVVFVMIFVGANIFHQENSDEFDNQEIVISAQNEHIDPQLSSTPATDSTYARTAFVLYQNKNDNHSYLFRADFVTANHDKNDQNVVSIKTEQGELVAYDSLSNKMIPNFTPLLEAPLSLDAAVLYADIDNVIIKNKINNDDQLEMLDAYTGDIIWTLSSNELVGIGNLTGKYLADENRGIELVENGFMVKLPPNYYIIGKKGDIVDYGQLD